MNQLNKMLPLSLLSILEKIECESNLLEISLWNCRKMYKKQCNNIFTKKSPQALIFQDIMFSVLWFKKHPSFYLCTDVPLPVFLLWQKLCCCPGADGWLQKGSIPASLSLVSISPLGRTPGASCPPHCTGKQHWHCCITRPSAGAVSPPDGSPQGNRTGLGTCPFHLGPSHLGDVREKRKIKIV